MPDAKRELSFAYMRIIRATKVTLYQTDVVTVLS